jgi:membrane protein
MLARLKAWFADLRERTPWLDHLLRMVAHYGAVNGNGQAGGVTFFGFLSFFPLLALGFFVVGLLSSVYPDARGQLVQAIDDLLPGVIGGRPGQVQLATIEESARTVGLVGLAGLLYSGLGWLSGLRQALAAMFVVPRAEHPSFLVGKARDLGALAVIGLTLLLSVALSSAVTGFSGQILAGVGIDPDSTVSGLLLWLLGHALGILASTVLLLAMFGLLVEAHVPRKALVGGALLGAVGFEVLKLAANLLLGQTQGQPAFQAFGVALILLVWINYFSRLVMYSAAWAYTAPASLAERTAEATRAPGAALTPQPPVPGAEGSAPAAQARPWWVLAGLAGVAALLLRGVRR